MEKDTILGRISTPFDLKYLGWGQLDQLCGEIRRLLVRCVAENGGHLASNLGVVELTVALHKSFASPIDQMVWDVGHQCYVHKLLTGRKNQMSLLRRKDGISGFPNPEESEHDAFISGHASTAISVADGLARAKALIGEEGHVIAVVGDGALSGGLAFEGLNNIARGNRNVIVVLNDNKMSISKNVGGFTRVLSRLRTAGPYYRLKDITKSAMGSIPVIGEGMVEVAQQSLAGVKSFVYNRSSFFEEMGFAYMGPVDGHDVKALCDAMARAKKLDKPVLLHVETVKGKGYTFAEENPGAYHGVSSFDPRTGGEPLPSADSFSGVFGRYLTKLAVGDRRICAVTAAMKYATGLHYFSAKFKGRGRFFDVGIAEGHGVTFSAALASKGLLPVFAVYASFLQRGYDQLLHDCAISRQHVVLAVDRAGFVGEDGATHQGLFDSAFLSGVPGSTIYAPASYRELELCMDEALFEETGLCAIRYPRGAQQLPPAPYAHDSVRPQHFDGGERGLLIVSWGRQFAHVCMAEEQLRRAGHNVSLLKLAKIWPLPELALSIAGDYRDVLFVEEGARTGGVAEHFVSAMALRGHSGLHIRAVDEPFLPQASVEEQREAAGLDAQSIYRHCRQILYKRERA